MRKVLFVICLSIVAALVAAGPAAAGNPQYSNIKTTATCTLNGEILFVDVGFVYSNLLNPGPPPLFSGETITLEKHVAKTNKWEPIATLFNQGLSNVADPVDVEALLCNKQRTNPTGGTDFNFFGDFGGANALRAVVTLNVSNANPKQGQNFTARCISFPPPVCTTP